MFVLALDEAETYRVTPFESTPAPIINACEAVISVQLILAGTPEDGAYEALNA